MILGGHITIGINAPLHAGPYLVSVLTAIEEDREHKRLEKPDLCPTQISASPYTRVERVLNAVDQVNQPQDFLARLSVVLDTLQNTLKRQHQAPRISAVFACGSEASACHPHCVPLAACCMRQGPRISSACLRAPPRPRHCQPRSRGQKGGAAGLPYA